MNIFIYGDNSFINEMNRMLEHGNIKFKLEDGVVEKVKSLEQLKHKIKSDPFDIFLIDESKIIKEDFVSKYLKFLLPKDGIKEDFLEKHGIGDVTLRDKKDLSYYITKRLESSQKKPNPQEITTVEEIFEAFEEAKE